MLRHTICSWLVRIGCYHEYESHAYQYLCFPWFFNLLLKFGCNLYLIPEPAAIVEKPESIQVTTGDTCTLECTVTGTPELSTKWFKDGKELTSDSKYKISFFNKVSGLKIINVAPGDSGVYSFEVQNPVGKDSCTASVRVSGWLVGPLFQCYYNVVPDLHIWVWESPSSRM